MWEAARAEADRKRVDSHHAATQNRQLRDMLGWQRLLARNPRDPVIKCAVAVLAARQRFSARMIIAQGIRASRSHISMGNATC